MVSVISREAVKEANAYAFSLESLGTCSSFQTIKSCSSVVLLERRISPFGGLGTRILR